MLLFRGIETEKKKFLHSLFIWELIRERVKKFSLFYLVGINAPPYEKLMNVENEKFFTFHF